VAGVRVGLDEVLERSQLRAKLHELGSRDVDLERVGAAAAIVDVGGVEVRADLILGQGVDSGVVVLAGVDDVVAGAAVDDVAAVFALDRIVAFSALQDVVPAAAVDLVITGVVGSAEDVVGIGTVENGHSNPSPTVLGSLFTST
jgi:hypothetical protein